MKGLILSSVTAIRKDAGLFCGFFPRKGEAFACFGSGQNPQDLKHVPDGGLRPFYQKSTRITQLALGHYVV
jgi:hypothetical protein